MSSIVVGIGRSDSAPAVAAIGDRLTSSLGLPLILVHATTGAEPAGELLERADPRRGIGTRRCVVIGGPTDALPRVALENDAVLLVIGNRHLQAGREMFHRSSANAVVRAASQPVVLVSEARDLVLGQQAAELVRRQPKHENIARVPAGGRLVTSGSRGRSGAADSGTERGHEDGIAAQWAML